MKNTILVTGGAGYIGSHTCVELLEAGFEVIALDNFCNSKPEVVERIKRITGKYLEVIDADVRDGTRIAAVFAEHDIFAVIHFAGLKAVGESVAQPLMYYDNNVQGTLSLLSAMRKAECKRIVFSSSATVYGSPASVPILENFPLQPASPYGQSKAVVEQILTDLSLAEAGWNIGLLRYFNPVGAHESGLIGEDPNGIPNNLMPYVSQVAVGKLARLTVHGGDYPTRDGTGERDYIHVMDLARGHVAALNCIDLLKGAVAVNLGTGLGSTVLEVIAAFNAASGVDIPYTVGPRRPGDIASCYADAGLAERLLGWRAQLDLASMCADSWRWQQKNPNGYVF